MLYPEKENVLCPDYAGFDNFFPLVTLDLSHKGIMDKIHIIYVSFNYNGRPEDENFPPEESMGNFTFDINPDNLYKPSFSTNALVITEQYRIHFERTEKLYRQLKDNKKDILEFLRTPKEPDWLQNDLTPFNSLGDKYNFICQLELELLFEHVGNMYLYVFYDAHDKKVKYFYQCD